MKILVSIDDTDNIDSRGTGELAAILAKSLEDQEWGNASYITRHQLLVHQDIPYTSHNSSMCFMADIQTEYFDEYIAYAGSFLKKESANGSDPGLCIAVIDKILHPEDMLLFGFQAKEIILGKEDAYKVANKCGIHLSEHGGTGLGVIGALAGAALRMSGNDGRFRGKLKIGNANEVKTVGDIKKCSEVEVVQSLDGLILEDKTPVRLGETVKAILLKKQPTLLVFPTETEDPTEAQWQTCTKNQLKVF